MATISELIERIGKIKNKANSLYGQYKDLKEEEESLKYALQIQLREAGLKSAKGSDYTASIASRSEIIITSEPDLMEWLQNTPNIESDFYIGVKRPEFTALAKSMLKDTGELANGTQVEVRESLSIRGNK